MFKRIAVTSMANAEQSTNAMTTDSRKQNSAVTDAGPPSAYPAGISRPTSTVARLRIHEVPSLPAELLTNQWVYRFIGRHSSIPTSPLLILPMISLSMLMLCSTNSPWASHT
ncbi:hypothetical protein D3C75_1009350 [compost metagenome]